MNILLQTPPPTPPRPAPGLYVIADLRRRPYTVFAVPYCVHMQLVVQHQRDSRRRDGPRQDHPDDRVREEHSPGEASPRAPAVPGDMSPLHHGQLGEGDGALVSGAELRAIRRQH